jgi:hypothetical protein
VETGTLQAVYHGSYRRPYRDDPPPRREILPRRSFWTPTILIALSRRRHLESCCTLDQGLSGMVVASGV